MNLKKTFYDSIKNSAINNTNRLKLENWYVS